MKGLKEVMLTLFFVFCPQTEAEKTVSDTWKKTNGLIHRERPAGRESPQQVERDVLLLPAKTQNHKQQP